MIIQFPHSINWEIASLAWRFSILFQKFILRWGFLQEMIVNVFSNFPPGTGETGEVGVCYQGHPVIEGIKPTELGLVEELYKGKTIIIIRFLSLLQTHFVALVQWRRGWPWCRRSQSIWPPWRGQWRLPLSVSSQPAGGRAEWRDGRTWWQWRSQAEDRSRWSLAWWLWTNLRGEIWWQTSPELAHCSYWRSRTTGWRSWSDWRLSKISPS